MNHIFYWTWAEQFLSWLSYSSRGNLTITKQDLDIRFISKNQNFFQAHLDLRVVSPHPHCCQGTCAKLCLCLSEGGFNDQINFTWRQWPKQQSQGEGWEAASWSEIILCQELEDFFSSGLSCSRHPQTYKCEVRHLLTPHLISFEIHLSLFIHESIIFNWFSFSLAYMSIFNSKNLYGPISIKAGKIYHV